MKRSSLALAVFAIASLPGVTLAQAAGAFRDVQLRGVDLENQVLEIHNFGSSTQDLDGWRLCTHDEDSSFRYTGSTGLNGQSLDAGESLFIHWRDDASGADAINASSLGGARIDDLLADGVGEGVSLGLYNSNLGGFGSAGALADHVQYSYEGVNVGGATPRAGVATTADLWGSSTDWVAVDAATTGLLLVADPFPGAGVAHTSASYAAIPEPTAVVLVSVACVLAGAKRRR